MSSITPLKGQMASQGRPQYQHKRAKSASVLRSIISSKSSKSVGPDLAYADQGNYRSTAGGNNIVHNNLMHILPADHPHGARPQVLSEVHNESTPSSPRKSAASGRSRIDAERGRSTERTLKDSAEPERSGHRSRRDKSKGVTPKKSKSTTNLTGLFKNNRSSKDLVPQSSKALKDKENATPPSSSSHHTPATPIWAQFATQKDASPERSTTTKIPLNDERSRMDEIKLYTPHEYSPGKRVDLYGQQRPMLGKPNARPKSVEIASTTAKSLFQPILRKTSRGRKPSADERMGRDRSQGQPGNRPTSVSAAQNDHERSQSPMKSSRVMAAVVTYDGKAKTAELENLLDPKNIDAAFEVVLDSRNIPEPMRQKMRTLKPSVKADFIRSHKVEHPQSSTSQEALVHKTSTTVGGTSTPARGESEVVEDEALEGEDGITPKRPRPRSRTFTFSKGDLSPSKKQKGTPGSQGHRRDKSRDKSADGRLPRSSSSTSLSQQGDASGSARPQKTGNVVPPTEFVSYLHEKTNPRDVEVGRLHKLRLLLRNETVAWVDSFIREGGMAEILALLHRVMEIEWREDHEDALLHETLLCLKGLTTTDLALQKLNEVASTLFPELLGMLFDREHKGPSEFTTRQIVINILFVHLSTASPAILPARARTILSYLQDQTRAEGNQPLPFVLDMRQPRPYRTWNKEVVNVTKEVFWIFLHQMNVVAMPSSGDCDQSELKAVTATPPSDFALSKESRARPPSSRSTTTTTQSSSQARPGSSRAEAAGYSRTEDASYTTRHFPPPRPPVPAAPYVGGVEWDATNYLGAHLDLLNGLISALPSIQERSDLRSLLRASGWEKAMGATLRTCKEKFYGAVHAGLRTWVGAASEDGWDVADVRFGPREEDVVIKSTRSSPNKKKEAPPQLDLPLTSLAGTDELSNLGSGLEKHVASGLGSDGWTFDL